MIAAAWIGWKVIGAAIIVAGAIAGAWLGWKVIKALAYWGSDGGAGQ